MREVEYRLISKIGSNFLLVDRFESIGSQDSDYWYS